MCGIAGCADRRASHDELRRIGESLTDRLHHRGPDDRGVLVERSAGVVLAHTRLAILDTSPAGAQPMVGGDGRYSIVYNGEVYNHLELRRDLEALGYSFRGHSDTETLLAAVSAWGLDKTLQRSHGMFAMALFDRQRSRISLARDRFGQKPLYHGHVGDRFVFCSDLVALGALGPLPDIDPVSLAAYFRAGAVPGERSIYAGLAKVRPGCIVDYEQRSDGWHLVDERSFWSLERCALDGVANPFTGGFDEAVDELARVAGTAVAQRMLSDVPIGVLLSGGVDSSLVTALMQATSSQPVKTYTVAVPGHPLDESGTAAAVARHLGTDHDVLAVSGDDLLAAVPDLTSGGGEPFSDPSQVPTYLICHHARRSVTVALGGDGGDELFGGYPWHRRAPMVIRAVGVTPRPVRRGLAIAGRGLSGRSGALGRRAGTLARVMDVTDPRDARFALTGAWKAGTVPILADGVNEPLETAVDWPRLPEMAQQLLWLDAVTFLPDTILTKVDRASMAASLEARAPLLDHEVARFAWSIPTEWRVGPRRPLRPGRRTATPTNKWILRRLLDRYVPRELTDRPKQGFDLPIAQWLRTELAEWAGDLVAPDRLRADGYLDPVAIGRIWDEHVSCRGDHANRLWTVLMFQSWLDGRHDTPRGWEGAGPAQSVVPLG